MNKTNKKLDNSRRNFMKKSAVVGAGVAASAVAGGGEAIAAVTTDESEAKQNKGYQLTQHVADYYKSAAS